MNEIFELYTESKDVKNIEEIINEVIEIMESESYGFTQLARYAVKTNTGTNILIELDVPETKENPTIFMTAYEYSGDIQNFDCENEIGCIDFNGDWKNLKIEMSSYAEELMEE